MAIVATRRHPSKGSRPSPLIITLLAMAVIYILKLRPPPLQAPGALNKFQFVRESTRILRQDVMTSSAILAADTKNVPRDHGTIKRVCLVTYEVAGPHLNGGIGTAFTNLALVLAKQGHHVTLVSSTGPWVSQHSSRTWEQWVAHFAESGVTLLGPGSGKDGQGDPGAPYAGRVGSIRVAAQSYAAFLWLRERQHEWDVIHFPESCGVGYFSLLAKHQKLYFRNTVLVVQTHGPLFWTTLANSQYPTHRGFAEADFLERKSVEMADVLVSPSHFMLEWFQQYHWQRPASTVVLQNVLNPLAGAGVQGGGAAPVVVTELVFFGRFEQRKGILLFLEALTALLGDGQSELVRRGVHVTLMGRATDDSAGKRILDRIDAVRRKMTKLSPNSRFQVLNNFDTQQARTYLKAERGRLVVVPSTMENLPYTVMESIYEGIPLLASDAGGTRELMDASSAEASLFDVKQGAPALTQALQRCLVSGVQPSAFNVSPTTTLQAWDRWHRLLKPAAYAFTTGVKPRAMVSVVLATYNNNYVGAAALATAIRSLEQQSYPAEQFEVIVVDDGSTDGESIKSLNSLKATLEQHKWRVVQSKGRGNRGLAKNVGFEQARGDYVLFLDDANVATPNLVALLESVMSHGDADILLCAQLEQGEQHAHGTVMQLGWQGGSWDANTMGHGSFMVRASVFRQLQGFSTQRLLGEEWEFLNKAWLRGFRVELLPQPLLYGPPAGDSSESRWTGGAKTKQMRDQLAFKSELQAFRPFLQGFGPEFPGSSLLALKGERLEQSRQTTETLLTYSKDCRPYPGYKNLYAQARLKGEDGEGGQHTWQPMNRVLDGTNTLTLPGQDYPRLDAEHMHPGHNQLVSMLWSSYVEGDVTLRIDAYYSAPAGQPLCDGVFMYVEVNDNVVGQRYDLTTANRRGSSVLKITGIEVGDTIRVVIDPKERPDFDFVVMKFELEI